MRAVVVALVAVVASCGKSEPPPKREPRPPPAYAQVPDAAIVASRALGEELANRKGCLACHSLDGKPRVGPSFKGLGMRTHEGTTEFVDGTKLADVLGPGKKFESVEAYIAAKTLTPSITTVAGFPQTAPAYEGQLTPIEMDSIVLYLESL
jgi:cytochrome c2